MIRFGSRGMNTAPPVRAMIAVAAAAAMMLSGCGTHDEPAKPEQVPVESLVGQTVDQVERNLPPASTMVSYDLSKPVTGAKARYGTGHDKGTHADWIVVAACANTKDVKDDTRLAAGVLHKDAYADGIARKAKDHAFDHYLAECK